MAIHDRQVAEPGGGSGGVRDEALLDSALARARQRHACGDPPPDLADLAAARAFGIARNPPFVDGNKRTAAVTCETCVELNGATLEAGDDALYPLFIGLAEGTLEEAGFAGWLRSHSVARPTGAVQERKVVCRR